MRELIKNNRPGGIVPSSIAGVALVSITILVTIKMNGRKSKNVKIYNSNKK